ncbi:MAG: ADP-ribosylation factor-like protein [Promethearchaeia archaeon]
MEYLKEKEDKEARKILFTGLDMAGKTSIIKSLQREFSKIAILKPTRGAQRRIFQFLGRDISEWDLGGQISYRISYLKNPSKYFDGTEICIYVIDIQNKPRIPEALSYLTDVIEQFAKLEIGPPIYVFFHKLDPALMKSAKKEMNHLLLNLKDKIKNLTDYKKLYFYKTTIYDLSTIITAMSEILLALYPKSELIEKTIEEFAKKVDAQGVVVLDDNSLIIGQYYEDEDIKHILSSSTPYFLTLNDSLKGRELGQGTLKDQADESMVVQRFGKYFLFKQISFETETAPYYLLLLKNTPDFKEEHSESFVSLLKKVLYK